MKLLAAALSIAIILVAIVGEWVVVTIQAQGSTPPPLTPQGLTATNGPNPGTATLSWTAVPGVSSYRIGRLSDADYKAYPNSWRERFVYSDFTATSAFTLTDLIPGRKYYFNVGQNHGGSVAWSSWVELTLNEDQSSCPTILPKPAPTPAPTPQTTPTPRPTPTGTGDYDADKDGLIEISDLAQLDAIRWDLDGNGVSHIARYMGAFPDAMPGMGCPDGCIGYELVADLDFDTNGNGEFEEGDAYWNNGKGWVPIGERGRMFDAAFDGGEHTIANLHINESNNRFGGLFGAAGPSSVIQNVGLVAIYVSAHSCQGCGTGGLIGHNAGTVADSYAVGSVFGASLVGGLVRGNSGTITGSHANVSVLATIYSNPGRTAGGLVGKNGGTIAGSYATGSVSGAEHIGGLVGDNMGSITGSYATSSVSGDERVGGLVGSSYSSGAITASYAIGNVSGTGDDIGGLVGRDDGTITASYAIGQVRGSDATAYIGGLVGYSAGTASTSYWNIQTTGQLYSADGIGKTTDELQSPTTHTGIYAEWNPDFWDFGTSVQYPVLKHSSLDAAAQSH